jgi:DNA modification methylase
MAQTASLLQDGALFYGDNLDVLKQYVDTGSVDLIYLDPPFNSNRDFNVLFARHNTLPDSVDAQVDAFADTWHWTPDTERDFTKAVSGGVPGPVQGVLIALRSLLGENDATAYLVNMAPRLAELHRVLKDDGVLFLHCDPTMGSHLRLLLDAIFGPENMINEIIWQRTTAKSLMSRRLPSNHDVILCYGKTGTHRWNEDAAFTAYDADALDERTASKYRHRDPDGRIYRLDSLINPNRNRPNLTYEFLGVTRVWRWTRERMQTAYDAGIVVQSRMGRVPQLKRYLDEQRGRPFGDVWTDINPINSRAAERLGYPTQKPVALLERLLALASRPGDIVLDPFCGCGTTIDAAERLGRKWIGVDVAYIAIDVIRNRLSHSFGKEIELRYSIHGIPRDVQGAQALFNESPFEFERWAVSLVNGMANQRQVGDRGIDGVIRFPTGPRGQMGTTIVSVKGGRTVNPSMVRDLVGTVQSQGAQMGLMICNTAPTRGMVDEANRQGSYVWPANQQPFPRIQLVTVSELLRGIRPNMPPALNPYLAPERHRIRVDQPILEAVASA